MIPRKYNEKLQANLPILGFGAMRLPTLANEMIDLQQTKEMVAYALAKGVNYFDTAHMYHAGQSQPVMGQILANYPRESFMLATKLPLAALKDEGDQERIFDEQLALCKVDYFDFYLAHAIDNNHIDVMEKFNTVAFLLEMKKQGKIKRLGFSFHDDEACLKKAIALAPWEFVQLQINYYDFELGEAKNLYRIAQNAGLPIFVMEPVRGGMLANMPEEANKILHGANPNKTPAAFAIEWVTGLEDVAITLSGMSNLKQLKENIETLEHFQAVPTAEKQAVAECAAFLAQYKTVGCTACKYCMPCPVGIEIPEIFRIYNNYKLIHNVFWAKKEYNNLSADKKPPACIHCGQCTSVCPQQLNVPDLLATAHAELDAL